MERRKWLDDREYADLVALCQFIPGPASSQVGFSIGLARGGILGALAAFAAFTLPSAVLLVAFALGAAAIDLPIATGALSGLKVVAVAVVAQAVLGMTRTLAPDARRALIAAAAAALALLVPGSWGQLAALALGAVAGILLCRADDGPPGGSLRFGVPPWVGVTSLAAFVALFLVPLPLFQAFYRSGALVFGGGHVVLPLLQDAVVEPGWVSQGEFLAGYGAAQAVPGPLFTFAVYLGAIVDTTPTGILGATVALLAIFLPGFLLLIGVLPFWDRLRARPAVRALMRGANAAVVGILAAALYDPVFTSAVTGPAPFVLALALFVLLVAVRLPPWVVVVLGAGGGILMELL